jgi:hypothetical protein
MSIQQQVRSTEAPREQPTTFRRVSRKFMRALGLMVALIATLALAAGVAIVGPNIEEWRGVLPSLAAPGYESAAISKGRELLAEATKDQAVVVPPKQKKRGKGFTLLAPVPSGAAWPAHWCGTEVIDYRVDLVGARMAGLDGDTELHRWAAAFEAWRQASGGTYEFRYQGIARFPLQRTNTPDKAEIKPEKIREGEIAITYATPRELPYKIWKQYYHPGIGPALGMGGIGPVSWAPGASDYGLVREATIILDGLDVATQTLPLPTVYIHEAGHALGLGHVKDERQMMFYEAGPNAMISSGDRRGITQLAESDCPG